MDNLRDVLVMKMFAEEAVQSPNASDVQTYGHDAERFVRAKLVPLQGLTLACRPPILLVMFFLSTASAMCCCRLLSACG